jgi:hypothetical protein
MLYGIYKNEQLVGITSSKEVLKKSTPVRQLDIVKLKDTHDMHALISLLNNNSGKRWQAR